MKGSSTLNKSYSTMSFRKTWNSLNSTKSSFYTNNHNSSDIQESAESHNYYYPLKSKDVIVNSKNEAISNPVFLDRTVKRLEIWDKENIIAYSSLATQLQKLQTQTAAIKKKKEEKSNNKSAIISYSLSDKQKESLNYFRLNKSRLSEQLSQTLNKLRIIQDQREDVDQENESREKLINTYKKLAIIKIKKNKYQQILNDTFSLLDMANREYNLSVDVLKERIKGVQKYYDAFINQAPKNEEVKNEQEESNEPPSIKKTFERKLTKRHIVVTPGQTNKEKDIFEERTKKYAEYLTIVEDINKEIKRYEDKYNKIKEDLTGLIKEIKEKIAKYSKDKEILTKQFDSIILDEKNYYLGLLKRGEQTRREGLSWIVKCLIQLGVKMDYSFFPTFLDNDQINYIIQVAELKNEREQLDSMMKLFTYRQNMINMHITKEALALEIKQTMKDILEFDYSFYNKKLKYFFFDQFKAILGSSFISSSTIKELENVFKDYIFLMRTICKNVLNNNYIIRTVNEIKHEMVKGNYSYQIKMQSYKRKNKEEYDEDIEILKRRKKDISLALEVLVRTQVKKFKEKYNYFTNKYCTKTQMRYQFIYKALFGNGIQCVI